MTRSSWSCGPVLPFSVRTPITLNVMPLKATVLPTMLLDVRADEVLGDRGADQGDAAVGGVVGVGERVAVLHGAVVDDQVGRGRAGEGADRVGGALVGGGDRRGADHRRHAQDVGGLLGLRDGPGVVHRELGLAGLGGVLAGGVALARGPREAGEAPASREAASAAQAASGGGGGGDGEGVAAQGADLVLRRPCSSRCRPRPG